VKIIASGASDQTERMEPWTISICGNLNADRVYIG